MINLEKFSGLPLEMRDDYSLVFGEGLPQVLPQIREFSAMKSYLKDLNAIYSRKDVYHMYRDLALPEHREAIHTAGLEYDITVIPPGKIGDEFVKTIGHYHPFKEGTSVRYPEVYEVIHGRLFLLIQSVLQDWDRISEVYLIEAQRREKVLVPPGFGHISINPSEEVLVLANWQSLLASEGIYEPYEIRSGGAYYVIESERLTKTGATSAEFEFVPNLNYKQVPPLEHRQARDLPQFDLLSALPMYFTATKNLQTLDFLVNPENYLDELVPEKLFK